MNFTLHSWRLHFATLKRTWQRPMMRSYRTCFRRSKTWLRWKSYWLDYFLRNHLPFAFSPICTMQSASLKSSGEMICFLTIILFCFAEEIWCFEIHTAISVRSATTTHNSLQLYITSRKNTNTSKKRNGKIYVPILLGLCTILLVFSVHFLQILYK